MKALVFGTSYVEGQERRYLIDLWRQLLTEVNPGIDLLVVDSASPDLPDVRPAHLIQLGDNIGHMGKTGVDGWGRAFSAGLSYAEQKGYDYAVHVETDLLFARPVAPIIEKMAAHQVRIAGPLAAPQQFLETALLFMDVAWVRESCLIERYDWATSPLAPIPERRLEEMAGPELFCLPLRGCRNDHHSVTPQNIDQVFPYGIDWLTHCRDLAVYRAFLRLNGFEEMAR